MIFEIAVVSILVIVSVAVIKSLNEINRNLLAIKTDREESTTSHLRRISGGVKHLCWWEYQKEKSRNPDNPIFTDPVEMGKYFIEACYSFAKAVRQYQ